jgi:hypothetical protein
MKNKSKRKKGGKENKGEWKEIDFAHDEKLTSTEGPAERSKISFMEQNSVQKKSRISISMTTSTSHHSINSFRHLH